MSPSSESESVVVATTARWLWVSERDYTADLCIVDEAWQMTYANLGGLGPLSAQVVLVGDPGQIAPVVTGDSRRWQSWHWARSARHRKRWWPRIPTRSPGCGWPPRGGSVCIGQDRHPAQWLCRRRRTDRLV
jgi:hypothetical protein